MDTERNLLFGVVAFQNGAVDADRLAETCAAWVAEPSQPLANLFVDRGLMTDEQKTEVEKVVAHELEHMAAIRKRRWPQPWTAGRGKRFASGRYRTVRFEAQLNLPAASAKWPCGAGDFVAG